MITRGLFFVSCLSDILYMQFNHCKGVDCKFDVIKNIKYQWDNFEEREKKQANALFATFNSFSFIYYFSICTKHFGNFTLLFCEGLANLKTLNLLVLKAWFVYKFIVL